MEAINAPLRSAFDALLGPFAGRSPMLTLVPIAVVVGVLALLVFKWTSNQPALDAARRRQTAGFFEIRLFNDDLASILTAQGRILRATGAYLTRILVPLAVLLPPLFLVVAQLQFHYGYEGLQPGGVTLVRVQLTPEAAARPGKPPVELTAPEGVEVETPSVWVSSERTLVWRVSVQEPGEHTLLIEPGSLGGETLTKDLSASGDMTRRSPVRPAGLGGQLLYPAEPALPPGGPVESIVLDYPDARVNLAGWHTHWLIAFFLLTIVAAVILRKPLRVTI